MVCGVVENEAEKRGIRARQKIVDFCLAGPCFFSYLIAFCFSPPARPRRVPPNLEVCIFYVRISKTIHTAFSKRFGNSNDATLASVSLFRRGKLFTGTTYSPSHSQVLNPTSIISSFRLFASRLHKSIPSAFSTSALVSLVVQTLGLSLSQWP